MEKYHLNLPWPGWEIVEILGHGNFGMVYKIQRTTRGLTEYAALKVIRIPKEESEIAKLRQDDYDDESITQYYADCRNKIEDEYALMATLKGYGNIVYCDDYFSQPHENGFGWDFYIKMELLTPAKTYLPAVISEAQVIALGIDICNALKRCEDLKIVHRDIKPENIFVSKEGKYKLGDFGIARTMEGTTGGTKTGTYDYMAPEVSNSKAYHGEVDIYSLGMVMYWMLNERTGPFLPLGGKKPTPSMKQAAWDRRFSGEQIPAPKNGSEALKAIVLKACAYDPKDRYQSAQEMLDALNTLNTGPVPLAEQIVVPVTDSTPATETAQDDELTVGPGYPSKPEPIDDALTVGPSWSNVKEEPVDDDLTVGPTWSNPVAAENKDTTVGPVFQEKGVFVSQQQTGKSNRGNAEEHASKAAPVSIPAKQDQEGGGEKKKRKGRIFAVCAVLLVILLTAVLLPLTRNSSQNLQAEQPHSVNQVETNTDLTDHYEAEHNTVDAVDVPTIERINYTYDTTFCYWTDGTCTVVSPNGDASEMCNYDNVKQIRSSERFYVGLKNDGTVFLSSQGSHLAEETQQWTNIIDVQASGDYQPGETGFVVGLKDDGTVVAAGDNSRGQCNVTSWKNIKEIHVAMYCVIGLCEDGTVVATGDVRHNFSAWTNIVDIAGGYTDCVIGLRSDGTVVATSVAPEYNINVSGWTDIVAVDAGNLFVAGLRKDGTVLYSGGWSDGSDNADTSGWTDIVAISAGAQHLLGLKADGTVLASGGYNSDGECNVHDWENVTQIAAGHSCSSALTADGNVLFAG